MVISLITNYEAYAMLAKDFSCCLHVLYTSIQLLLLLFFVSVRRVVTYVAVYSLTVTSVVLVPVSLH